MKSNKFWDVTPYSPVEFYQHLKVTHCFHFQDWRVTEQEAGHLIIAGYTPDLSFYPEDGNNTFLRKASALLASCCFLGCDYSSTLKREAICSSELHGVTSQMTLLFTVAAVRASHSAQDGTVLKAVLRERAVKSATAAPHTCVGSICH
jgi:hypothetical protein